MEFDKFEALLRGARAKYAGGRVPEGLSLFDCLRASDFIYHEDGVVEEGQHDFLEFLSKQALRVGS